MISNIWNDLSKYEIINDQYGEIYKSFTIKICEDNIDYEKSNYYKIKSKRVKIASVLMQCSCFRLIETITFIFGTFKINRNVTDCNGRNTLMWACFDYTGRSNCLAIIKWLIEVLNFDIHV